MTEGQWLGALMLWREARNQSMRVKAMVWAVMRNRLYDPRWPNTITQVVLQAWQFSSFNAGDPNATKWPDFAAKDWRECVAVVEAPPADDETRGANHYHDKSIDPPVRAWLGPNGTLPALQQKMTMDAGAFRFYRL